MNDVSFVALVQRQQDCSAHGRPRQCATWQHKQDTPPSDCPVPSRTSPTREYRAGQCMNPQQTTGPASWGREHHESTVFVGVSLVSANDTCERNGATYHGDDVDNEPLLPWVDHVVEVFADEHHRQNHRQHRGCTPEHPRMVNVHQWHCARCERGSDQQARNDGNTAARKVGDVIAWAAFPTKKQRHCFGDTGGGREL